MAKKRSQPTVPAIGVEEEARATEGVSVSKSAEPPALELASAVRILTVDLPVAPSDGGLMRHLEVQLESADARAFRQVLLGLQHGGYRLRNGRLIDSAPKAMRWLLEQISDAVGKDDVGQ